MQKQSLRMALALASLVGVIALAASPTVAFAEEGGCSWHCATCTCTRTTCDCSDCTFYCAE